jgi:hypothetical protein
MMRAALFAAATALTFAACTNDYEDFRFPRTPPVETASSPLPAADAGADAAEPDAKSP